MTTRTPVVATAPRHVETVRTNVLDTLTRAQAHQLSQIAGAILGAVDPTGLVASPQRR
ncbi:MAG TPA: hypothetical protein VES03_04415 [Motilibacterales bacterium]|nr:hypothetical protein [Motilibacterales bacterium]